MQLALLKERFALLTADFDAQSHCLLGAIALERVLGKTILEKLSPPPALAGSAWIERSLRAGLLVPVRALRQGSREPHFSVHSDYQQLALRSAMARGDLAPLAAATRALLTVRSVSDLNLALQSGDLDDFTRRARSNKALTEHGPDAAAAFLRSALSEPFDAAWFESTFAADTRRAAARVLLECLHGPDACSELYAWALAEPVPETPDTDDATLASALYQQAIFRDELPRIPALVSRLPAAESLALSAAARFLGGDLVQAQARLDESLGLAKAAGRTRRAALPDCGGLSPLYALLLWSRDTEEAKKAAKALLVAAANESSRGFARGLRVFERQQNEPQVEHRRIDVHQLEAGAGAWEVLVLAFTVALHSPDPWARANWAQYLVRRASNWLASGYAWLAQQALALAEQLNAEYFGKELLLHEAARDLCARRSPKQLFLWDLITIKAEWQRALEALKRVSESVAPELEQGRRALWFVDMVNGELSRPALQEWRPNEGWTEGRRVALAELWQVYAELPSEDQRVLDQSRETASGGREFTSDASEALIGHPRVVNGARGMRPVEVVRGVCRVSTEEERGYVRVVVEPAGASLGVHVQPEGDARLVVYRVSREMRRVIEALPQGARVPKAHERELYAVLGKLSESIEVQSPELGGERTVEADATPCLRFSSRAGAWLVELGVRPFGEAGRFFLPGVGRAQLAVYEQGQRLRCVRDLELERARSDALRNACPTLNTPEEEPELPGGLEPGVTWSLGEEGVLGLLAELREVGTPFELEWPESGGLKLRGESSSKTLHGRLRSDKGWYLVTGGIRVDEVTEVALSELVRAPILGSGRFVRLENGDFLELEARIRRVISALRAAVAGRKMGTELRLPAPALFTLAELTAEGSGIVPDVESRAWIERASRVTEQDFELPVALCATLRPYQREGFRWLSCLSELGLGACLADDMGLGKTVQIIALLLARAEQGRGPALVVAPTSVCSNWVHELARFAPSLRALDYSGKDRVSALAKLRAEPDPFCVVVCSYTVLQQDQPELSAAEWGTAVLDEAQFIKNPQSLRARAAFTLKAQQRIIATGTPVENHLGDLWSLFHFLNPGLLGDWAHFKRSYVMPVERDGDARTTEQLRNLVKPYVLRRMKGEVLADLPPLTEVRHDVELSPDESLRYAVLRRQIHDKLYTVHGKRFNKLEVLAELMRLRRFCCHPSLVFPDAPPEFSKLDDLLDLVNELRENGHRALVFSQFVDFLSIVRTELDARRISYEYLDGSTPQAARAARVEAFQSGTASLFLISLKAGGFGLNLTAADYVIHLDPWWNPAVQAQATDRAHRIGQERPVTVYRLVVKDSIEERMLELHEKKEQLAEALLDGEDAAGKLSVEDLLQLIAPHGDSP